MASSPSLPAMASSLRPGVLAKLLQDMDSSTTKSPRHRVCRPPSLLQVTGIIPLLSRTGLSPDGGFHLEVSDSSQSIYVSLPPDETDHILTDRLQVGQLIHVRCLRPSYPVPVLLGLRLLPGRHCLSSSPVSRPPNSPGKAMQRTWTMPVSRASRKRPEPERRRPDEPDRLARIKAVRTDVGESEEEEESASLSMASSPSCSFSSSSTASSGAMTPRSARRKSWKSLCGFKETAQGIRSLGRSQSVSISRSEVISRYTPSAPKNETSSSDEQLAGRREASRRLVSSSSLKQKLCESHRVSNNEPITRISPREAIHLDSSIEIKRGQEKNAINWASLPSSLLNHGKELEKQRESALNAAVDALLEASVSERLMHCLSVYSEIQADKVAAPSKLVTKFLILHRDLSEVRSLAKSLSKPEPSPISTSTAAVAAAEAMERKKRAASWIRAALESDLSPFPDPAKSTADAAAIEFSVAGGNVLETNSSSSSRRRSALVAAANLAGALNSECNRWFLKYIEQFLDDVARRSGGCCETNVAGLFCQLKRIDEWLEAIVEKDRARRRDADRGCFVEEEEEVKACERVRKKIYGVLLNHAEYAATALENMAQAEDIELDY